MAASGRVAGAAEDEPGAHLPKVRVSRAGITAPLCLAGIDSGTALSAGKVADATKDSDGAEKEDVPVSRSSSPRCLHLQASTAA